jgi:hypothetical protein
LTAAKFKPLIFPVLGFVLSNVANICILYNFCLLPVVKWLWLLILTVLKALMLLTEIITLYPENNFVACMLKARIMKPAEAVVTRECLYKHIRC